MNQQFRNRKSPRKKGWDYTTPGDYFITINTKNWQRFFGQIRNKKMHLSEAGKWAEKIWTEIPDHFSNVKLGAFVVMPDHVHGIVGIVGTGHALSVRHAQSIHHAHSRPIYLSTIIGSYKSAVSKNARKILPEFEWHVRFHDRIIRDSEEYSRIKKYIIDNPENYY